MLRKGTRGRRKGLDIDGLVEGLSFFPEDDDLHDHLFEMVGKESPRQLTELVIKLAEHDVPELRMTAATRIDEVFQLLPGDGAELWSRLLHDEDPHVSRQALESLEGLGDREDVPFDAMITLGRLGAQYLAEQPAQNIA